MQRTASSPMQPAAVKLPFFATQQVSEKLFSD
jgi:hypothetical protein